MAQPPRSNPGSSSGSEPPLACITPSTVTCVMVVSFMVIQAPHSNIRVQVLHRSEPVRAPSSWLLSAGRAAVRSAREEPIKSLLHGATDAAYRGELARQGTAVGDGVRCSRPSD